MYMYYTEIVPEQKKFNGGGVKEEGEQITEVRLPLSEMDRFLADYEQEKSAAIIHGHVLVASFKGEALSGDFAINMFVRKCHFHANSRLLLARYPPSF